MLFDGAFAFETRKYTETGSNLVFKHFTCFGLQMHIGSKSKPSKIECIFLPTPGHFKLPTPTSTALPTYSSSSLLVMLKQKKENGGTRQIKTRSNVRQRKGNKTNSHWCPA